MKRKIYTTTLLLACFVGLLIGDPCTLNAQNWAPLNPAEQFNFQSDTEAIITAVVFPDSISMTGNDSAYHLNRIVTNCDTCAGPDRILLANQPQFLMRKAIVRPSGLWNFQDSANIALYTWAQQGDNWLLDSTAMISAMVDAILLDSIFSQPDSVKRILLSSGDTILLAQNHGVLQWPEGYGSGIYHRLVGIKGRNLGKLLPGFGGMYNWHVGDVLEISSGVYQCNGSSPCYCWSRLESYKLVLDSVNWVGNSMHVAWHGCHSGTSGDACIGYQSFIGCGASGSFVLTDSADHFTNHYPNQLIDMGHRMLSYYDQSAFGFPVSDFGGLFDRVGYFVGDNGKLGMHAEDLRLNGYFSFNQVGSPFLTGATANLTGDSIRFLEGMGMQAYNYENFEVSGYWYCGGYYNGIDTIGGLTPDSLWIVANDPVAPEAFTVQLYPNPNSGRFFCEWKQNNFTAAAKIEFFAASGVQVSSLFLPGTLNGKQEIDLSALESGLYYYRVSNGDGYMASGRLLIQR
jgi:hypothetical protein